MKAFFDKLTMSTTQVFYNTMIQNLKNEHRMFIVTANPETFMIGKNEEEFKSLLIDQATTIVPDGIGIVKTANQIGYPVKERIPGVEIAQTLLESANLLKKRVFLFGAKPEVIKKMKEKIRIEYPGISLVGATDGYIKDKDSVFDQIRASQADVILVALGIPTQEKLIYKHLGSFQKGIFVGVGGSFDVLSGMKKRAPKIFIKLNLEWLYRIIKEPSRWKRFYDSNVKFIWQAKKIKK